MHVPARIAVLLMLIGSAYAIKCWTWTNPNSNSDASSSDVTLSTCDNATQFCMKADFYPTANVTNATLVPWVMYGCADKVLSLQCSESGSHNVTNYPLPYWQNFSSPNVQNVPYNVDVNCCNNYDFCNGVGRFGLSSLLVATIFAALKL